MKSRPAIELGNLLSTLRKHISPPSHSVIRKMWDVDTERNVIRLFKVFLLVRRLAQRREAAFVFSVLVFFFFCLTNCVKAVIYCQNCTLVVYSCHGLFHLCWTLPGVFLCCFLPGCSRPCPLLHWHFRSPQLLGFLCLLWATPHVPQPGFVDLLVSWKPRGTSGRPITSLRFSICVIIRSTKQISGLWCWTMESALKLQVQIFTFKALCSRE